MTQPRIPEMSDWLLTGGALVLGVVLLVLSGWPLFKGMPREEDLLFAEGVAADVFIPSTRMSGMLKFRVGKYQTEYLSDFPNYKAVAAAVADKKPVRLWVAPTQTKIFPGEGALPLYKFAVGKKLLVTYADSVERERQTIGLVLMGGVFLTVIGAWSFFGTLLEAGYLGSLSAGNTAPEEAPTRDKHVLELTVIMSLIIYALMISMPLRSDFMDSLNKLFEDKPLGLSPVVIYFLAATVAFLPVPWFLWCLVSLLRVPAGRGEQLSYWKLLTLEGPYSIARQWQKGCLVGLVYLVLLLAAWIYCLILIMR